MTATVKQFYTGYADRVYDKRYDVPYLLRRLESG